MGLQYGTEEGTTLKFEDGKLEIMNISRLRFWFAMAVNALRSIIAGALCYYGILFVGYTAEIDELLLNAVSLEFVINVDELLYEALAPRALKEFYNRLAPFVMPTFMSYRGIDLQGALRLLFTAITFGVALGCLLIPQVRPAPISRQPCANSSPARPIHPDPSPR